MTKVQNPYRITIRQANQLANTPLNCNVLGRVRSYVLGQTPAPNIPAQRLNTYVSALFQLTKPTQNYV